MTQYWKAALASAAATFTIAAAQAETKLLGSPALSDSHLAFTYAGDIYIANRDGSEPRRLTSHAAEERSPIFSPDGQTLAFTGAYHDQTDVYTISIDGGQPERLTWHPGNDEAISWLPDGNSIAFISRRETNHGRSSQLYAVETDGGLPNKMMEARIFHGELSPDGTQIAYMPYRPAYNALYGGTSGWRGYRGGSSPSITILDIESNTAQFVPGERVNDIEPMWLDGQVYFVSDRDQKVLNIHVFDPATGSITKVTDETVWDIRSADAHDGTIVYEAGGELKQLDVATGSVQTLSITLNPDLPQLQPAWKSVARQITNASISKTGQRVAVTARGEVFSIPVEYGSTRNVSNSSGVREYDATFSNDGLRLAYIVEADGIQKLVIEDQSGRGETEELVLGPDFYSIRAWTGDDELIIVEDNKLNVMAVDAENGLKTPILTNYRRQWGPGETGISASPDGRWLAVTREEPNFQRNLYLYDFEESELTRVTDYMADVGSPAFSKDGKHLFFAASTNSGPSQVGLDMTTQEQPYRAGLYVITLEADGTSPLAPRTGDEEAKEEDDENGDEENGEDAIVIDLETLNQRIEALPVAQASYADLATGADGALYYIKYVQPGSQIPNPGQPLQAEAELVRFDFDDRDAKTVGGNLVEFDMSADGKTVLVLTATGQFSTAEVGEALKSKSAEMTPLDLSGLQMRIDPREEWAQIFDDVWRMQPNFFYDPNLHGLDWIAIYERYRPLVDHAGRREDLNRILAEMIAELEVGHNRVGGGDVYNGASESTGLLGADLTLTNGRTQIARIYNGENWNPNINAPLSRPGIDVSEGDFILAVNGREVGENDNVFELLAGTTGQQTVLEIADTADGRNARDVLIEPTGNEFALRLWAWVEGNRKAVDAATDGRVGYVYLPNTTTAGYTFFNRMFFAQTDKDAMIIDERSNGGGQAANYITDVLSRTYLSGWKDFAGATFRTPGGAMFGPKIMLIDQDAGSGGDFLPYSFREMEIGTLMGTRTWGGLIGIAANPMLVDGGFLTVPYFRFFDADFEWTVENQGVAPDIEVTLDPVLTNLGRDSQLEAAITEIQSQMVTNPSPVPNTAPAYPTQLGQ
ncbi:MAG: PDZ domain-containing protein [Pseudomonadota bacterium]